MTVIAVVADGEFLVLRLFPQVTGSPRCPASDHENHVAAAPVRENDPTVKERNETILSRGPERGGRGQFAHRERCRTIHQYPRHARPGIGKADAQPLDRLLCDSVFLPEPCEDLSVSDEPLVIHVRQRCQCLADAERELMRFLCRFRAFHGKLR